MSKRVEKLKEEIKAAVLDTKEAAENFRVQYLGRKAGKITDLFKAMKEVAPDDRPAFGQKINDLKTLVQERLDAALTVIDTSKDHTTYERDLTLPGRVTTPHGSIHPITQTLEDIKDIFGRFGFSVADGPEVEDDWHNFTALNFPPDHPARDMQDTFFIESPQQDGTGGIVLRTHTSPVQIRVMKEKAPPIRVIVPGRVYRNEAISYKSFCLFHQVEGLYVDEGVTFADLKKVLHLFAQAMFGEDVQMRFRPSFFPFTEPSAEVDIWWPNPDLPDGGRWLEILGCGMVDPNVYSFVDIDAERYTGYAFGMGVERIAMLRYGIQDIRILYENDIRFLEQF